MSIAGEGGNMAIARTENKVELFFEPGQTAAENYTRLLWCLLPICGLPLVCFTHPPAIKQGVRDASGTVLPGRVRTVFAGPMICNHTDPSCHACMKGPHKEFEFPDDMPARLRADVVAMVVAKAASYLVMPDTQ